MNQLDNISTWIPQRPPFVFIDTIGDVSERHACTQFTVRANCPLVRNGSLSLAGLMENAAQSCAARAGWIQRQRGEKVKIGYIGAIKQMQVTRYPRIGEVIQTEAVVMQEVMNITLIECITRIDSEIIATTILKLAIVD